MNIFKVGDTVRKLIEDNDGFLVGEMGIVCGFSQVFQGWPYVEVRGKRTGSHNPGRLQLVYGDSRKNEDEKAVVRFVLQYELDQDPFETFATMKEVEERIKELAKRPDLKRESIKVYEIAKTYDVKLETRIIFGGVKVKLSEQPTKKRGRPVLSKEDKAKAKKAAYMKKYYARKKAVQERPY